MHERIQISFPADREILRGWFYQPSTIKIPAPCIIMTHGFSALKEHGLAPFAEVFTEAGFCVLIYDHRNTGESSGEPRNEINPQLQIQDYSHAISYVQSLPVVDRNAIGIWGTSYSGGHVLVVGATDKRVKSVVAQVPFIHGHHDYLRHHYPTEWINIEKSYQNDRIARAAGKTPQMVTVVAQDPHGKTIMKGKRAYDLLTSVQSWANQVTLQSVAMSGDYTPGNYVAKMSPTPVLFIIADQDNVNSTKLALKAYEQTLEPKKLIMISGDHFSPQFEQFIKAAHAARDWYLATLF